MSTLHTLAHAEQFIRGNTFSTAAGQTLDQLAVGQVNIFDAQTGLSVFDGNAFNLPERFYFGTRLSATETSKTATIRSADIDQANYSNFQAEVPQVITVIPYSGVSEYNNRYLRDREGEKVAYSFKINLGGNGAEVLYSRYADVPNTLSGILDEDISAMSYDELTNSRVYINNMLVRGIAANIIPQNAGEPRPFGGKYSDNDFYTLDVVDVGANNVIGNLTALDAFINTNRNINTDVNNNNDGPELGIRLTMKARFDDYTYEYNQANTDSDRVMRASPVFKIEDSDVSTFNIDTDFVEPIGMGAILREREIKSKLNSGLSAGGFLPNGKTSRFLTSVFQNGINYNVLSFRSKLERAKTLLGDSEYFNGYIHVVVGLETPLSPGNNNTLQAVFNY